MWNCQSSRFCSICNKVQGRNLQIGLPNLVLDEKNLRKSWTFSIARKFLLPYFDGGIAILVFIAAWLNLIFVNGSFSIPATCVHRHNLNSGSDIRVRWCRCCLHWRRMKGRKIWKARSSGSNFELPMVVVFEPQMSNWLVQLWLEYLQFKYWLLTL